VRLDHLLSKEHAGRPRVGVFVLPCLRRRVSCGVWWLIDGGALIIRFACARAGVGTACLLVGVGRLWLVRTGSGHAVGVLRKRAPAYPPLSLALLLFGWGGGGWGWFSWWPAAGRAGFVCGWCGLFFENCTVDASILKS
jgi:hypothetical protein